MSSNTGQPNRTVEDLIAKNSSHLEKIETAQEPKIMTMPYDRRQEEIELLRTAVQFQPTLYMLISQLATQKDMERSLNQTVATEEEYMRKMANSFSEKAQTVTKEVSELLQQDGKRREKFISDCTQALQTERDKLTAQLDSLRKRTRRLLIAVSITAIALSALVSYLVCRVLGS